MSPNPKLRTPLVVACILGCLVGFTGCSDISAIPTHHARHPPAQRPQPRGKRAEPGDRPCTPIRCRRFTVSGSAPIPDTTSDPDSDQGQANPGDHGCAPAQYRHALEEANDVVDGAGLLGAPDAAALMQHFLSGRGTPVTFGPTSPIAKLVARNAAFRRTNRAVEAVLKQQLVPAASDRRESPAGIELDRGFLVTVRPDFDHLARDPDLYLSFRGTQGLSVRGAGRAYLPARPNQTGHASGELTYTISDVYGFSSEPQFRLLGHPVGPDLHYLQTTCGAPAHKDGAHWFRDSVTVTTHFRFSQLAS